jgi:hypothetical protein
MVMNTISFGSQIVLKDMVELQLYLVSQSQQSPWPLLPRGTKTRSDGRTPSRNSVESSAATELIERGLIERTSNRTFVVSKSGFEFYKREMRPYS